MTLAQYYQNWGFTLGSHQIDGKYTALGLAVLSTCFVLAGLRRYFAGGWCNIQKDLTGKNVVITGGNTGIGKETARRLLELNANVIIGARDAKKNLQTSEELSKIGKGKITVLRLDLAERDSIEEFATKVKALLQGRPLHYLLNNAGVMAILERKLTRDGLEMQMGTNHFGHFYLTYLLWDKLKQSGNPRIVNVSSAAHREKDPNGNIDFDNMAFEKGGYYYWAAYSRSKKANILFSSQLQRRMDEAKINGTALSLHPGVVKTELIRYMIQSSLIKAFLYLTLPITSIVMKNATEGAQTNLYCLLEDDDKIKKGAYYADCKVRQTNSKQVLDEGVARRLWEESEKTFGIKFAL